MGPGRFGVKEPMLKSGVPQTSRSHDTMHRYLAVAGSMMTNLIRGYRKKCLFRHNTLLFYRS